MTTTPIDLRAEDQGQWLDLTLPGSEPPVRMRRLHADPETKASVSLVRFPAGWRRPGTGWYPVAEEFVVLEGGMEVVGTHGAGDYVYLPPRAIRAGTASPQGALVLAYFAGAPKWTEGQPDEAAPQEPVHGVPAGVMRKDAPEVAGSFQALDTVPAEPVAVDTDILWLESLTWELLPAGATPTGSGRALVRTWA
ncbi:cupin domain-containing protein [Melissospora conviva]|uniref:cupin domain-containing protein n=1 Tax=Melissospora conviva TaxID=3388432 RepID=UPI003C209AA9